MKMLAVALIALSSQMSFASSFDCDAYIGHFVCTNHKEKVSFNESIKHFFLAGYSVKEGNADTGAADKFLYSCNKGQLINQYELYKDFKITQIFTMSSTGMVMKRYFPNGSTTSYECRKN